VVVRTLGLVLVRRLLQLADRVVLAVLARLLPRDRWPSFLVTPGPLQRWHRELVIRRWTYPHTGQHRGVDPQPIDLVPRMARENPRWGTSGSSASAASSA
jgi:hypothetical protein